MPTKFNRNQVCIRWLRFKLGWIEEAANRKKKVAIEKWRTVGRGEAKIGEKKKRGRPSVEKEKKTNRQRR